MTTGGIVDSSVFLGLKTGVPGLKKRVTVFYLTTVADVNQLGRFLHNQQPLIKDD